MSTASVPLGARSITRRRPPASVRRQRFLFAVANHSLLIASAIAFLAPFAFITLTALMTNDQALSSHLWPHPFRWQNFADVFHQAPILRWTVNTMIYSGLATLGLVLSSVPVAYALARLRWRGRTAASRSSVCSRPPSKPTRVSIRRASPPTTSSRSASMSWSASSVTPSCSRSRASPDTSSGV